MFTLRLVFTALATALVWGMPAAGYAQTLEAVPAQAATGAAVLLLQRGE